MKTSCVVATGVNRVETGIHEIREPQPGEVLVETCCSTLSPGTELRCLAGKEPNAGPFPMITGYSMAGIVRRGTDTLRPGDRVFVPGSFVVPRGVSRAWGAHMGHAIAPASAVLKLPPDIDLSAASALGMLAIALHGVIASRPVPGDRVLVAGLGLIGQLAVLLYRLAGCRVAVSDPMPGRRRLAAPDGRNAYVPGPDGEDRIRADVPAGFDIVVDATGVPAAVAGHLPLLRAKSWENPYEPSPRLVLLASYPGDLTLEYQEALFNKEAQIVTCRNYLPHERERAARLLHTGAIDLRPILSARLPAADAANAFRRLRENPDGLLTVVLDWGSR